MKLVKVDENLIDLTSNFAQGVFVKYYTPINGKDHAQYMANMFLSKQAIKRLIDEGAIFKLVMKEDKPIAYIEYKKEENRVFLSKFYVHEDYRGQGIGNFMFQDLVDYTKSVSLNKIYLTVNKHNTNSYELYLHKGFKVIDSVETDIGNNYIMDDYIMELTL